MIHNNKLSLYSYLGVLIVAVVTCVVGVYATISYFAVKQSLVEEMDQESQAAVTALKESVTNYIETYAVNEYEKLVANQMRVCGFQAIIVTDYNMGHILGIDAYQGGSIRNERWQLEDFDPEDGAQQHILSHCYSTVSTPIVSATGEALGSIMICNSDRELQHELIGTISKNVIYTIAISALLMLLLFFAINRSVLRPVMNMMETLIRSGEGGVPLEKVAGHGPREIASLAGSINRMIDIIHVREQQLRQSETRFRQLVEQMPAMVFLKRADDLRFELFNRAGEALLGYDRSDLIGKNDYDLFDRAEADAYTSKDREVLAMHRTIEVPEEQITTASGEVRVIQTFKTALYDEAGQPLYLLGVSLDITEKKRMQAKDRMLSRAIEQSGEAIIITDAEGTIEHVNPAFSQINGYEAEEVIGNNPRILKSGNQGARFYEKMWEQLLAGETWQGKVVNRRKDGMHYPAMLTISPIRNEDGEITNYIGVQQNLEKFEQLEAQFHQSQKMEAIGTLVGGIAHDFNNTLAGITGNLYLARQDAAELPKVTRRLEAVEQLAFSAAATIQQLLAFSRKGIVKMNPVSVVPFLKEVSKLQRASIPENVQLDLNICDQELFVNGDVNQLQQVVLNLVTNAYHAVAETDAPKITISVSRYRPEEAFIKQHSELSADSYACIEVRDNGCGIEEQDMEHIFEPFFTTKETGKGTGLGLSMVYGAVQTHGGTVEVESVRGKGTAMRIYLPELESDAAFEMVKESGEVIEGDGETILLADDNQTVLETGRDVLTGLGYRVLTARDGEQAVREYAGHHDEIDLVILDVVMPGLGGVKALQAIRELNPDVKAMFATGYDKLSTLHAREVIGQEHVITKPFSISKLSQIVYMLIHR